MPFATDEKRALPANRKSQSLNIGACLLQQSCASPKMTYRNDSVQQFPLACPFLPNIKLTTSCRKSVKPPSCASRCTTGRWAMRLERSKDSGEAKWGCSVGIGSTGVLLNRGFSEDRRRNHFVPFRESRRAISSAV